MADVKLKNIVKKYIDKKSAGRTYKRNLNLSCASENQRRRQCKPMKQIARYHPPIIKYPLRNYLCLLRINPHQPIRYKQRRCHEYKQCKSDTDPKHDRHYLFQRCDILHSPEPCCQYTGAHSDSHTADLINTCIIFLLFSIFRLNAISF